MSKFSSFALVCLLKSFSFLPCWYIFSFSNVFAPSIYNSVSIHEVSSQCIVHSFLWVDTCRLPITQHIVVLPDTGTQHRHSNAYGGIFSIVLFQWHGSSESFLTALNFSSIHMQRSISGRNVFWHSSLIIASWLDEGHVPRRVQSRQTLHFKRMNRGKNDSHVFKWVDL